MKKEKTTKVTQEIKMSQFKKANQLMKERQYQDALSLYQELATNAPHELKKTLEFNISLCKKRLPYSSIKAALVIHVFYLDIFEYLLKKIKHLKLDLIVTASPKQLSQVETLLKINNLQAHLIESSEGGYDIYPFLQTLPYLIEKNYDFVCKLHTKKGLAGLEETYPEHTTSWLDMLMQPILKNQARVAEITSYLEKNKDIALVGVADLYKSSKWLAYGNEPFAAQILQEIDTSLDPAKPWGFFAGSIFWARVSSLKPLLKLLETNWLNQFLTNNNKTGEFTSIWHALERVFGQLANLNKQDNALVYTNNKNSDTINIVKSSNSKIPTGNPYGVGNSLDAYINLEKNLNALQKTNQFDFVFYRHNYSLNLLTDIELLYHYLRYGAFENCNPNKDFSTAYYLEDNRDISNARANPFIHYLMNGKAEGRQVFPAEENTEQIKKLIHNSKIFDASYYLEHNPDVARAKKNPLEHYIKFGYKEKRQPCSEYNFDQIWYIREYLNNWRIKPNPLLHYLVLSKKYNLQPRPNKQLPQLSLGTKLPNSPKRICLFAGYDQDGLIDDYVIKIIKELAKHSDIYYLADSNIPREELEKINPYVKQSWAFRHGEYDFGSYMRLCRYLVGWETIRQYDELLLVNDSSYLIDNLDNLFQKMNHTSCDWWGLQATKGISATKENLSNQFKEKIPFTDILTTHLGNYEQDEVYDFHIGSYFLAFRSPLLKENSPLEQVINNVEKERGKKNLILSYEIGLTRHLVQKGYKPATFINSLYPFHPVYTKNHFQLIKDGFPFFKRFFLTENHYFVPELWKWKQWLKEAKPEITKETIKIIESNLTRVADASKLFVSLNHPKNASQWPLPLLTNQEFIEQAKLTQPSNLAWVFPVCAYDHTFSGNERLVFEKIKNNPNIKKTILYLSKEVHLDGINVHTYPLKSFQGQQALLESKYIFIKHAPRINIGYPIDYKKHKVINLWHGIPLKRIGYVSLDHQQVLDGIAKQHQNCYSVISSSKIDKMAMASAFYPLSYHDIWMTGLPRNDLILSSQASLADVFKAQLKALEQKINGKRLVLFAPTFRNQQAAAYYKFTKEEIASLYKVLNKHNAILGLREHMADKANSYSAVLLGKNAPVVSLDREVVQDIELIYRKADLLITDYSSCFIDFMLTGKPLISFAYDLEAYEQKERGFFYNMEQVFPGPICQTFQEMLAQLDLTLTENKNHDQQLYNFKRDIFFEYKDANNTQRLIDHVFLDMQN